MVVLDINKFRMLFPQFSDETKYPDEMIQIYWEQAQIYIEPEDGPILCGPSLEQAIYLMTAHLMALMAVPSGGGAGSSTGAGGVITSKTVGSVSYTIEAPPSTSSWDYYLNQTAYGKQLLFLLSNATAGGFYIGGLPERRAFRKVGGSF